MKHNTVHTLIKATTLSLLVLGTATVTAGLTVMTASPALSQPDGSGTGSPGTGTGQPDPPSTTAPTPVPPLPVP
jgi:hypothetical protein